MTAIWSFSG